jgi:hypothetical protein
MSDADAIRELLRTIAATLRLSILRGQTVVDVSALVGNELDQLDELAPWWNTKGIDWARHEHSTNETTDLYRFYDSRDRLLYIGISLHAAHRASEHKSNQPWWPHVQRMEVEHLTGDRTHALEVERLAIITERPLHNIVHNAPTEPSVDRHIVWRCDICRQPIDDTQGYVAIDDEAIKRYRADSARWDADHQGRTPSGRFQAYSISELLDAPQPAQWRVLHRSCDPDPHQTWVYWIGVETCRTLVELLDWTCHLLEKGWLDDTNWNQVVRRAVAGRQGAS